MSVPVVRSVVESDSLGNLNVREMTYRDPFYDTEKLEISWRRVEYPVREAQNRIRDAGLPSMLAYRLALGV